MKIYINGFWPGFKEKTDGVNYHVFEYILEKAFNCSLTLCDNINDADILLESWFSQTVLFRKQKWNYNIFFSAEGLHSLPQYINLYNLVLGSNNSGNNFVSVPLYLLYDFCKPSLYPSDITSVPMKGIVSLISAYNPESYRNKILDVFKENNIKVDNAGNHNNNIGYKCPGQYYEQPIIDLMKNYRLVLAFENSVHDDYITEKILNPFRSGTIPVYYGSDKICEYFNKDRFLIINKNNMNESMNEINRLLVDNAYWLEKVNKPIFVKNTEECIQNIIEKIKKHNL